MFGLLTPELGIFAKIIELLYCSLESLFLAANAKWEPNAKRMRYHDTVSEDTTLFFCVVIGNFLGETSVA